jgi:hypothetical protein
VYPQAALTTIMRDQSSRPEKPVGATADHRDAAVGPATAAQDVVARPRIEMVVSRTVIGGPVSHGADVVGGLRFTRRMQVDDLLHPGDHLCPTKMSKGPAPLVAGLGPVAATLLERRMG